MKKLITISIAAFATLSVFLLVTLNSCEKIKNNPFYLYVTNPFSFDIRIIGDFDGCDFSGDGCVHYEGKIYEGKNPGHGGNIFAYNNETDEQVGAAVFDGDMEGGYSWTVGYDNPLVKIESSSGNNGGNNGGGSNGGNNNNNDPSNEGSIVFYCTGNLDECAYVEVSVSKEIGSDGMPKDPIVKTFKGIVKLPYDEQKDVSCGMQGAATFKLAPGKYYIKHKTVNCTNAPYYDYPYQWRTIEKGKCIKVRLTR